MKNNNTLKLSFFPKLIILLCLLTLGSTLWAQTYVFIYKNGNNYNFLSKNSSNAIENVTAFNASTCLFTQGTDDVYWTFVNEGYYLRPRSGTYTYNLNLSSSTTRSHWTNGSNGRIHYSNRYLNYNNGWTVTNTTSPGTGAAYTVLFEYSSHEKSLDDPTITGNAVLSSTGTYNYSVAATFHPAYSQFDGYSGTNTVSYYHSGTAMSTSIPSTNITTGSWTLVGGATYASVGASTGTITVNSLPDDDLTMTLKCQVTSDGLTKTAEKTILLYGTTIASPTFTRIGNNVTLSTASSDATIYYTTDGTTPTASSTPYTSPIDLSEINSSNFPVTIKAIAVRNSSSSVTASKSFNQNICDQPVFGFAPNGYVVITAEEGATIYYTTNGDEPNTTETTTNKKYTGTFQVTSDQTIKAIAVKANYDNSSVATTKYPFSGVSGGVVTLNDYEDHNWTYYSDPKSPIKSLYPRNVKITYYGNGLMYTDADGGTTTNATGVAVSRYETANTFVYYKTLERDANNSFPYTLIPNPFSKRPTYNSDATTKWRGFYKWRVKSVTGGGIYEASTGGSALGVGSLLDAEKEYYFRPTDNTATNANNATSMTVELEAVWARAYRVTATTNDANTQIASADLKGGSYERNFVVISSYATNRNTNIVNTNSKPVTITMIEPDGSADYRSATVYINPTYIMAQNDWRFEWINIQNNSSTISANGHNLVLGRGILRSGVSHNAGNGVYGTAETDLTASYVNGLGNGTSAGQTNYTSSLDFKLRIESGAYSSIGYLAVKKGRYGKTTSTIHVNGVYGNDYDRAIGNNDRLISKGGSSDPPAVCLSFDEGAGIDNTNHNNYNKETLLLTIKSGYIGQGQTASSSWAPGNNGLYMGGSFGTNPRTCGNRRLLMEGGKVISITGGMDRTATNSTDKTDNNVETLIMRFKGTAEILTSAFGGAAENPTYGNRHLIFTGGMVHGWVATGCNGIAKARGQNYGIGYMYVGGNAKVGDGTLGNINGTGRGIVMGAGNGRSDSETTGEMTFGSNVVIADNADIESHVFGGGNYGYVGTQNASNSDAVANIYIAGGTVHGNVYGGSNQKHGEHVKITMVDGLVEGGIYGGSNVNGDIRGNVELHINGGQIGTSTESANVHGGGLGNATRVLGNVSVAVGKQNTDNTVEGDAVIYGDVYGGSAQGKTNGNTALTAGKTTQVTINAGTIYGSVYGGGLGNATYAADVYGPVTVTVNGGKVCSTSSGALGAVFGCNNANGRPQGKVNVDVTGGEMEYIYGGGNAAPYTVPTPNSFNNFHVKMSGGTVNKHVFGGGLGSNAIITGNTEVLISGSATVKGNVYGGGNAGTVTGDTNVRIGEN